MQYAKKYGVSRASRKYNKSRSYIYFWKQRLSLIHISMALTANSSTKAPISSTAARTEKVSSVIVRMEEMCIRDSRSAVRAAKLGIFNTHQREYRNDDT